MNVTRRTYNDEVGTYQGCPGLKAPASFWFTLDKDPSMIAQISNGCGAKIKDSQPLYTRLFYRGLSKLINTMWFLNVSPCCDIHDWGYLIGKDERDREHYDHMLLDNHITWVRFHTKWGWLRSLRFARAMKFYTILRLYGAAAFWADK